MSVQTYLNHLASSLVLSTAEKASINTSIHTLGGRLQNYFGSSVSQHYVFGSFTRGTILPRRADDSSDIDYLVIFNNPNNYKPQTFLNQLKNFVEHYYSRSEIHQSHPTIVLELQHIKFELVPAVVDRSGKIYIPSPATSYGDWMSTDPSGFNSTLTSVNSASGSQIKPLIRLMKYWNTNGGRYYSSFLLEKWIAENQYYFAVNIKDYLYSTFDRLSYNHSDPQYFKNKLDRAKTILANVKDYESRGLMALAEQEIMKLLPTI